MLERLKALFGRSPAPDDIVAKLEALATETMRDIDFDDPAQRVGAQLYMVLRQQFELIGKPEGEFPYVPPFASDKARGALLGTAIAIVKREFDATPHKDVIDAAITAFTLSFGDHIGKRGALQTIQDAAEGNEEINFASDWAIKDTRLSLDNSSPASPSAYYLAVAEMI